MTIIRGLCVLVLTLSAAGAADKAELDRQYQLAARMDVRVLAAALKAQLVQIYGGAQVFSQEQTPVFLGNIEGRFGVDSIFNTVGMHG